MAVTLSIRSTDSAADGAGSAQTLTFDQPRVVVGRGAHADVRLPARAISSAHFVLKLEGAELSILDESSTNGTLVNGALLVKGRRKVVRHGDRITVPGFELILSTTTAVADSPERTATVARKLLSDAIAAAGREATPPTLELRAGRAADRQWAFAAPPSKLVVGRGDNCDIIIEDPDASRHHAEFVRDEQGVIVRDLSSKNGIFVAGRKVQERRLRDGDEFQIGRVVFAFRDPADELLRAFDGGADDAKPLEAQRPSTIPPPAPGPGSASSDPGAASAGLQSSSSVPPGGDGAKGPSAPPEAANPGADPSKSTTSADKPASNAVAASKKKGSLDWVVALLALLILGVSVMALVLVLRPR